MNVMILLQLKKIKILYKTKLLAINKIYKFRSYYNNCNKIPFKVKFNNLKCIFKNKKSIATNLNNKVIGIINKYNNLSNEKKRGSDGDKAYKGDLIYIDIRTIIIVN